MFREPRGIEGVVCFHVVAQGFQFFVDLHRRAAVRVERGDQPIERERETFGAIEQLRASLFAAELRFGFGQCPQDRHRRGKIWIPGMTRQTVRLLLKRLQVG